MPIYEEEGKFTVDDLLEQRKRNKCKECGGWLNVFMDHDKGLAFLACNDYLRTHHEGIEREASRYEKEGLESLNIPRRREIMVEEHGEEKTKALAKYVGGGVITKAIATEIVETLWGKAPKIEKTKAIILCQTYQLNPLMKHLHLVGYRRKGKDGKFLLNPDSSYLLDWTMMIGIGATRLMAQRKHNYSYLDMTPRKASVEEINKILGDTADSGSVYGFVHIKDIDSGAEAFGLRGCSLKENIKGREKGNTHLNQACVRAERQALDRQYPGEMPPNIEVIDERFIDAEYKVVDRGTGEITEHAEEPEVIESPEGEEPPEPVIPEPEKHWCEEHNCAFELKRSRFGPFFAHKTKDGYCNEKKRKEAPVEPVAEEAAEEAPPLEKPKRDTLLIVTINNLYKACYEDFKNNAGQPMQPEDVLKELNVTSQNDITDTPAECYARIAAVR